MITELCTLTFVYVLFSAKPQSNTDQLKSWFVFTQTDCCVLQKRTDSFSTSGQNFIKCAEHGVTTAVTEKARPSNRGTKSLPVYSIHQDKIKDITARCHKLKKVSLEMMGR